MFYTNYGVNMTVAKNFISTMLKSKYRNKNKPKQTHTKSFETLFNKTEFNKTTKHLQIYVNRYSPREGIDGKLAGLIYRMIDSVCYFFNFNSDYGNAYRSAYNMIKMNHDPVHGGASLNCAPLLGALQPRQRALQLQWQSEAKERARDLLKELIST